MYYLVNRFNLQLRQNVADLQEMMTRIFSGIFVHRYRYLSAWQSIISALGFVDYSLLAITHLFIRI